jgi:hypothetical protein
MVCRRHLQVQEEQEMTLTPAEVLRVKALCQDLVQELAPTQVEKYLAKTILIFDCHTTRLLELYYPLSRFSIVQLAQEFVESDPCEQNKPVLDMLYYKTQVTDRRYFYFLRYHYPEIERAERLAFSPLVLLQYLQSLPEPFLRAAALAAAVPQMERDFSDDMGSDKNKANTTFHQLVQLVANPYHADVFGMMAKKWPNAPAITEALAKNQELAMLVDHVRKNPVQS